MINFLQLVSRKSFSSTLLKNSEKPDHIGKFNLYHDLFLNQSQKSQFHNFYFGSFSLDHSSNLLTFGQIFEGLPALRRRPSVRPSQCDATVQPVYEACFLYERYSHPHMYVGRKLKRNTVSVDVSKLPGYDSTPLLCQSMGDTLRHPTHYFPKFSDSVSTKHLNNHSYFDP